MRRAKRVMLWASCTVPAVAAMVMTGVGTAGATTLDNSISQTGIAGITGLPSLPVFGDQGQNQNQNQNQGPNQNQNQNQNQGPNQNQPNHNPPGCSKWQPEKWNLNGGNTVVLTVTYVGHSYPVTFRQRGSCLTGSLTDAGYSPPTTGPILGTVKGDDVTFTFDYPANSIQGARTFTGTIDRHGAVIGSWAETGTENAHGYWDLATNANPACPPHHRWHRGPRECQVR